MSGKKPKATRKRMISCFAQIVKEHIPGWKIEQIAAGEKVKSRDHHSRKKDAMAILRSYGIAPAPDSGGIASGMPYLPGFEKMFLKPVG